MHQNTLVRTSKETILLYGKNNMFLAFVLRLVLILKSFHCDELIVDGNDKKPDLLYIFLHSDTRINDVKKTTLK